MKWIKLWFFYVHYYVQLLLVPSGGNFNLSLIWVQENLAFIKISFKLNYQVVRWSKKKKLF